MENQTEVLIPTDGESFDDGTAVDLIRDTNDPTKLALIRWNGSSASRVESFEKNGATYVPIDISSDLLNATQFPSGARHYGTTRRLFDDIAALITRTRISAHDARLVAHFVIATWFPELVITAPFLWVNVAPTASAALLRQLLNLLCRRSICYADLTVAEFRSRPSALRPTIVADLRRPTSGIMAQLAASNEHGYYRSRKGELIDGYCAKAVFAGKALRDPADAGFPLEVSVMPTRQPVGVLDSAAANEIAGDIQPQLEMYRLVNFRRITAPNFDLSRLTLPMQNLALTLTSPIIDDDDLQSEILTLLAPLDEDIRLDRALQLDAIVLESLLAVCHDPKLVSGVGVSVTDITRGANTILVGRGGTGNVSPETIGWVLRKLGVPRQPVHGGLQGVVFDQRTRTRVHELAAAYGVLTCLVTAGLSQCADCASDDLQNVQRSA